MKRSRQITGMVSALFVVLWVGLGPVGADPPTHVYVYNGDKNGFDGSAEGYAWAEAGFTNPDGSPMTGRNDTGDIVDANGDVVGTAIKNDDGKVIGWQNTDTGKAIIDINKGTFEQAFQTVSDSGTIVVAKHGVPESGGTDGGRIQLDNGEAFRGFNKGTGVPGAAPYSVPGRTGANINIDFITCYSAKDPDGDGDDMTSITESAKSIPGVASATGRTGKDAILVNPEWETEGVVPEGVTDKEIEDAIEAKVRAAAEDNKNKDNEKIEKLGDWLHSLPFAQRHAKLVKLLANVKVKGHTISLKWTISYLRKTDAPLIYNPPMLIPTDIGGTLTHQCPSATGLIGSVGITDVTDLDTISGYEGFHLRRLGATSDEGPDNGVLSTGIYELSALDGMTELVLGQIGLEYDENLPEGDFHIYAFDGDAWVALLDNELIHPDNWIWVDFSVNNLGNWDESFVFAGFVIIPEPVTLSLLVLGGLALMRRRRK